jgi:hypothetical protein
MSERKEESKIILLINWQEIKNEIKMAVFWYVVPGSPVGSDWRLSH